MTKESGITKSIERCPKGNQPFMIIKFLVKNIYLSLAEDRRKKAKLE